METTPQVVSEGDALATIAGIVIANLDMAANSAYAIDAPWLLSVLERIGEHAYAAAPHLRPKAPV